MIFCFLYSTLFGTLLEVFPHDATSKYCVLATFNLLGVLNFDGYKT